MGKVKDGTIASKAPKPSSGKQAGRAKSALVQFFLNLARADLYKPLQGYRARLYTAVGLGITVALGIYHLIEVVKESSLGFRYGVPAALALALGWTIFRIVHFPPFADFLIATEAEMNKVSWTSRDDLYRATVVVLATVALTSTYLFGVDWIWSYLLQLFGILKFGGDGAFGSTA